MADRRRDDRRRKQGARRAPSRPKRTGSDARRYAEQRDFRKSGRRAATAKVEQRRAASAKPESRRAAPNRAEPRRRHTVSPRVKGRRVLGPRMARRRHRQILLFSLLGLALALLFAGRAYLFDPPDQRTEPSGEPSALEPLLSRTLAAPVPLETREPEETPETAPVAPDVDRSSSARHKERKADFYTFLLAGVDDGNGGSDTMIFVAMDAANGSINGVSLPRDTKAIVKGEERKLNFAYNAGGMELLAKTVTRQLGIPVDYTVEVDLAGFAALVDAIGGVDFDVPIDMDYYDPKQNLRIDLKAGMQHLNGENALKVVRFRHNSDGTGYGDEDLGRIRTQQAFLKTVAKKIFTPASLKRVNKLSRVFQDYVKTDLTVRNLAYLAKEAITIGADGVAFQTLPGTWRNPYIIADRRETLKLINEKLNPYVEDRTANDLHLVR